jgi:plastocyanin
MRRLLALAVALTVCAGGSLGAVVAAGASRTSTGAPSAGSHTVKRSKAARCATLRRAATQRLAAKRRAAARRARALGCRTGAAKRPETGKPVVRPIQAPTPGAAIPPAGTVPASPGPAEPVGPAGPGPVQPPPPPPPPPVSTLGVSAYDIDGFVLRFTRTSVTAGQLTVFFRNYDVSDHNLWIASPDGDVVERISDTVGEGGGGSHTLAVTPGAWRLFCALPDHDDMTRTLTVTP